MTVDFRKQQMGQQWRRWKVKFLGAHITDKLKLSTHTDSMVKAQQCLFNLRRLKKCGLSPYKPLQTFTDAQLRASFRAILMPGTATAPPATAGLSRGWCGLPNAYPGIRISWLQGLSNRQFTLGTSFSRKLRKKGPSLKKFSQMDH
jgi:hypothetical protein